MDGWTNQLMNGQTAFYRCKNASKNKHLPSPTNIQKHPQPPSQTYTVVWTKYRSTAPKHTSLFLNNFLFLDHYLCFLILAVELNLSQQLLSQPA
jgi:hypothetical protein